MNKLLYYSYIVMMTLVEVEATYTPKPVKQSNLSNIAYAAKHILQDIGLVFGIGMVLSGLYHYTEHRSNPLAHPFGRVMTLVLAGGALIGVYFVPMPHITRFPS